MKDKIWSDEKKVECVEINGNLFLDFDKGIAHSVIKGYPTFIEMEKGEFHRVKPFLTSIGLDGCQKIMLFSISKETYTKGEVLQIQRNHIQSMKGGAGK